MIDKSMRPDYVMQGKVKNYLGKQKMVKAPKKWKSGPGHPNTELAYITKAEKDLILKADLHDSLSKGPNKGPSGIISLNSAGSGYGGGGGRSSSGGGGGGGGGGGPPNRNFVSSPPPTQAKAPTVSDRVSPGQSMAMVGNTNLAGKTQSQAKEAVSRGEGKVDVGFQEALRKQKIEDEIALDTKEKFISNQYIEPTDIYGDSDLEGQKEIDDIRAKRELQSNPNLSRDRQKALEVGLGLRDPKQSSGIGSFLKNAAMAVVPGLLPAKLAMPYKMYRGYKTAKKYVPKIGDIETALKSKLTNNFIGTGDNKVATQNQNKKRTFNEPTGDGNNVQRVSTGKDAVTESIKKYTGISDTQKAEAFKRKSTVENILKQGSYQGKQLTNQQRDQLTKYIAQIEQYLVPVEMAAHGGRIDKPITGRSRDI